MTSILHIWDQAGVACILAKYQTRVGYKTQVIKRAGFDRFGILSYYNGKEFKSLIGMQFLQTAKKFAKDYEIIHIHDLFELVPQIKKKYNGKKIVLHYHGSKLRETPHEKRKDYEKHADLILVSTPDLTKFVNGKYLPNPVDTELFVHRQVSQNGKALSFMTQTETPEIIEGLLRKHKISLEYEAISRDQKPIQYKEMPEFLQNYEYLIDLKCINGTVMPAYSMLGLQALSLGLKVLNYNYEIIQGLPEQHEPNKVIEKLSSMYEDLNQENK